MGLLYLYLLFLDGLVILRISIKLVCLQKYHYLTHFSVTHVIETQITFLTGVGL